LEWSRLMMYLTTK